jgi:hypothetical protein
MFDGGGRHGVAVHPALDVRSESSRCTVKNDPMRTFERSASKAGIPPNYFASRKSAGSTSGSSGFVT